MIDLILHALGGAAMAGVELALTGNVALAIFWPTLLGNVREQEQHRKRDLARHHHPSAFWRWDRHELAEWLAWPLGALLAACGFALR